jgi:hypothetical protein
VRSFAAYHAAYCDQRVILSGLRHFFCGHRQFERTGYVNHIHVGTLRAGTFERVDSGSQQPVGDKAVEPAGDNANSQSAGAELAMNLTGL